jgi:hypothetical protein
MEFTTYKGKVQEILKSAGWNNRGIFYAFKAFKIAEAHANGESPESLAARIDRDARLGMAS